MLNAAAQFPVYFRVVSMMASENSGYRVTLVEQRRPMLQIAQQAQNFPHPIAPPTGQASIDVEVSPDTFASMRIGQNWDVVPSIAQEGVVARDYSGLQQLQQAIQR